jgi:Spy/CpxP family protein refolding chaperone
MFPRVVAAVSLLLTMTPDVFHTPHDEEPAHRWWKVDGVQQKLRLTPLQVQKLDAIFEYQLPERIALQRKIDAMHRLLERTLERGNADDDSVARLSEQVEALRAQQNVRRTMMLSAMYRTLTREQRAGLAELRATESASPPDRESRPRRD